MTDRIAVYLGAAILVLIAADIVANGGAAMLFLLKKTADMIEYLAFWR